MKVLQNGTDIRACVLVMVDVHYAFRESSYSEEQWTLWVRNDEGIGGIGYCCCCCCCIESVRGGTLWRMTVKVWCIMPSGIDAHHAVYGANLYHGASNPKKTYPPINAMRTPSTHDAASLPQFPLENMLHIVSATTYSFPPFGKVLIQPTPNLTLLFAFW